MILNYVWHVIEIFSRYDEYIRIHYDIYIYHDIMWIPFPQCLRPRDCALTKRHAQEYVYAHLVGPCMHTWTWVGKYYTFKFL